MRAWSSGIGCVVLVLGSCASPGPAAADPAQPPLVNPTGGEKQGADTNEQGADAQPGGALSPDTSIDQILDALDARGRNLDGFVADVKLKEEDDIGQSNTRTGKVWFQKSGPDDARIRVSFVQREDEKRIYPEKIDYVLQKGWLIDRDHRKKIEIRRQVLKPGEKVNLLKLGEGPFPLPIGQKKEEVHRLFDVEKPAAAKDDPAGTIHVRLKPKEGTQFARKFSAIDAWVDEKTHFPRRIDTVDASESNFKSTDLSNVTVNPKPALTDRDFTFDKVDESAWDIRNEPFSE